MTSLLFRFAMIAPLLVLTTTAACSAAPDESGEATEESSDGLTSGTWQVTKSSVSQVNCGSAGPSVNQACPTLGATATGARTNRYYSELTKTVKYICFRYTIVCKAK